MQILMVASENDALPGYKVGGVADVLRDIPPALAALDHQIDVLVPDYGKALNLGAPYEKPDLLANFDVHFAGMIEQVSLYQLHHSNGVRQLVLSHNRFSAGGVGSVYSNDPDGRPFSTDATKFAFFSACVAEALLLGLLPRPDVLHLHDWHAATTSVLLKLDPRYHSLSNLKLVYTVHNLALQGIRPFKHDESSFEGWFPHLSYDGGRICDPRYLDCYNPMRAAITYCDKVHLVSPTYAEEVLKPSNPVNGYFGGEGLEWDLHQASLAGKTVGILNGCMYPDEQPTHVDMPSLLAMAHHEVLGWMAQNIHIKSVHYIALKRIEQWQQQGIGNNDMLLTSVGRLTEQKMLLLKTQHEGRQPLAELLEILAKQKGRLIILGSGDPAIEHECMQLMAKYPQFLFLNGYGAKISDALYELGDLFLMPSSFEPCGISQMLAMRAGQPCLVHGVGGLKDTVKHNENGFVFNGEYLGEQVSNMLTHVSEALSLYHDSPNEYEQLKTQAAASRFEWQDSVKQYVARLYS